MHNFICHRQQKISVYFGINAHKKMKLQLLSLHFKASDRNDVYAIRTAVGKLTDSG